MKRRMMGTVAGMLALALAACGKEASAPVQIGEQQAHLIQRTQDLAAKVTAAGYMSDGDRATLTALARDVDSWQTRNGSGAAGDARHGGLRQEITYASRGGGSCAGVCVPVVVMGDLICFISGTACIGGQKRCFYECAINLTALPPRQV